MKKFILQVLLLSLAINQIALAEAVKRYVSIIDAGSSGSRMHLYQLSYDSEDDISTAPVIEQLYSEKVEPGLSSYAKKPDNAWESIESILKNTQNKAQELNISEKIPLYILATAGMRMLTYKQQMAIYQSIKDNLIQSKEINKFEFKIAKTITGKREGLYGWLDANYMLGNLKFADTPTIGIIDMGGASTQIAFEPTVEEYASISLRDKNNSINSFVLNGETKSVYSKSFLGLGQDKAMEAVNKDKRSVACYPDGYKIEQDKIGKFDYDVCKELYLSVISNIKAHDPIPDFVKVHNFIGLSTVVYDFDLLKKLDQNKNINIVDSIKSACKKPWKELQTINPKNKYVSENCTNSTYLATLIFSDYRIEEKKVVVSDDMIKKMQTNMIDTSGQASKQEIEWAPGALIYLKINDMLDKKIDNTITPDL